MAEKNSRENEMQVLVTGDVVIDHHIYKGKRDAPHVKETPGTEQTPGTMVIDSPGGAILLYEIINKVAEYTKSSIKKADAEVEEAKKANNKDAEKKALEKKENLVEYSVQPGLKRDSNLNLSADHHSYAVWNSCLKKEISREKEDTAKEYVWRMTEPMGYGGKTATIDTCQALHLDSTGITPDIIVLDDGALGFRFCTHEKAWPEVIHKGSDNLKWVILKTSSPIVQGDLWRKVSKTYKEKLVVIVSINDLRREEAGITRGLSWERTVQELLSELTFNASIRDLLECRHLIISFGSEGSLWISNADGNTDYHLIYDPACLEGEWGEKYQGMAFGYLSCFTAGVVDQLARPKGNADIGRGIMAGLSAMRQLHLEGHGKVDKNEPKFPFDKVAEAIKVPSKGYSKVKVPPPPETTISPMVHWTIMEGNQKQSGKPSPLYGLARRVALFGTRALSSIPYARFEKLFTVDRSEMESLRGIRGLIKNYEGKEKFSRPLSIAVFGPPGSGKSFGIKQIARAVMGKDVPILEFNLSQFTETNNLIGAFHRIRDEALKGKMPFVFWDEFDSKGYTWLQYLLAPMQDGEFREGQVSHPIGKCVFVFAGGTSYSMENFGSQDKKTKDYEEFKMLKGPDFISRLNGYLNVLGPNKRQKFDKESKEWVNDDNPEDICFSVRRALLLRANFDLKEDEELDIDKGLLNAFLEIDKFEHGARSMETLALLTKGAKKSGLRRSDLPPEEQMSIHVKYDAFMNIIKRDLPFKLNAEKLAPYIHEFYRQLCKDNKWPFKHDKDYNDLPDDIKSDNVAAAERLPEVLYLADLLVVPEEHPKSMQEAEVLNSIEDGIEILAETEHDGWMKKKKADGWSLGTPRNDENRIHDALIFYKDMSEENKKKDRNAVRSYPKIVKMAGFKIIQNR